MKLIARFKANLIVDDLQEPNHLIKFIGITFIFLGVLYSLNIVRLNSMVIICITISGVFFILADICQHYSNEYSKKKALKTQKRINIVSRYKLFKFIFLFLATITLLIGPYIYPIINKNILDTLATSLSFIAIGLTIVKISLDNNRKMSDFHLSIIEDFEKVLYEVEKTTPNDVTNTQNTTKEEAH